MGEHLEVSSKFNLFMKRCIRYKSIVSYGVYSNYNSKFTVNTQIVRLYVWDFCIIMCEKNNYPVSIVLY